MIGSGTSDQAEAVGRFHAATAAERKVARAGAVMFADACQGDDVEALLEAADFLNENTSDGWRLAMRRVGRLHTVSREIQAAFLSIWIESKHMPLAVGHRPTMARALHVLMPPIALAEPLTLYRGTTASERSRRAYGFSWSTQPEVAEQFAEAARVGSGGAVLLTTIVPVGAVHLRREAEGYYDEGEVVVDPYRLGRVRVLNRLTPL